MYELLIYLLAAMLSVTIVIAIIFFAVALPFWRQMQKDYSNAQERISLQGGLDGQSTKHEIKLD